MSGESSAEGSDRPGAVPDRDPSVVSNASPPAVGDWADAPGGASDEMPIADPASDLPPAAMHILVAARKVLVSKGFSGLTLKAIAEESGENSAMVQYYFGNKAGLVAAIIDSQFLDELAGVSAAMDTVIGDDLLPKFVDSLRPISAWPSFRVFFDVLPYTLRHEEYKERMAAIYDFYRQVKLQWLHAESLELDTQVHHDALLGFAALIVAIVDGLAIQKAIDQDFDLSRPYDVLEVLLAEGLPKLLGTDLGHDSRSAEKVGA